MENANQLNNCGLLNNLIEQIRYVICIIQLGYGSCVNTSCYVANLTWDNSQGQVDITSLILLFIASTVLPRRTKKSIFSNMEVARSYFKSETS